MVPPDSFFINGQIWHFNLTFILILVLQYCDFSLLHRRYFISQANSSFFLWDSVTCFASCKPFYDLGLKYEYQFHCQNKCGIFKIVTELYMFRPPILPQVGSAHRPGRHEWRTKGLPQVWHQRHHQGTFPYYIIPRYYIIQKYLPILLFGFQTKVFECSRCISKMPLLMLKSQS